LKILIDGLGDLETAQRALDQFQGSPRPDIELKASLVKASVLFLRRQYPEALKVIEQLPDSKLVNEPGDRCSKFGTIGHIKRMLHDEEGALAAFTRAREAALAQTDKEPDDAFAHASLALVDASLGNRDAAIAEINQAKKLLPEGKDAFNGPDLTEIEAEVYGTLGDSALAVPILDRLLQKPGSLTVTSLKINPLWDTIRNDPAFQKLVSDHEGKK
jgi:tetratricopeptide (TPR) repeat protein